VERIGRGSTDGETRGGVERRRLGHALATDHVAINQYRVPSGERIAGLHAHADQEEVFVVQEGAVTFETLDGRVHIADEEAVRVPPGEFQSCHNAADDEAVVLALGAPPDSEDVRVPVGCPACDADEHRLAFPDGEEVLECPDCGAATEPNCEACGGAEIRVVLDGSGSPVERCRNCGATRPAR
jgi:uncharacterized cupin superfamily protein